MRTPRSIVRILLSPLPVLLAIGLVLFGRQAFDSASASHGATQGRVDFVSIDMDPTQNPRNGGAEFGTSQCGDDGGGNPGTGDGLDQDADTVADDGCPGGVNAYVTTVGSIEPCIQKALDTNYPVDITADQVHASDDLEGYQADLLFDQGKVNVIAVNDAGPLTFMGADLVATAFGPAPNTDGPDPDVINEGVDGSITVAAVDFGTVTNQQGEGILARVTLRNIAQGVSNLTLTNVKLNPGGLGNDLPVQTIQNAQAAGDAACSGATTTPTVAATQTPTPTVTAAQTATPTTTPTTGPTVTPTGTPTPSSSSTPSPGSSLTPTQTPTSSPSPTLSPSSTPTPTPSPTPVGQTPTPGAQLAWGNVDCKDVSPDSVDALQDLRHVAKLGVNQADGCPGIDKVVEVVGASPHMWGDVDCSGGADSLDALRILRHLARLLNPDIAGCPRMGELYEVR